MTTIVERLLQEARRNESLALGHMVRHAERNGYAMGVAYARRDVARDLRRLALECSDPDPWWRPAGVVLP